MKKIIFLLILISLFISNYSPVFSATATQNIISKLENSLYGFQYSTENDTTRLDRLENTVYGSSFSSKSVAQRIDKLKKDMSADLIGQEIAPVEDTFRDPEDSIKHEIPPAPKEASNVSYPVVDEMEKEVFKKTFTAQDITTRLSSLEKKTFNKTYNDDLNSRVERLREKINPKSLNNQIAENYNRFYDDDYVVPKGGSFHMNKYESPDRFDYDDFNARQNSFYEDDYYGSYMPSLPTRKASLTTVEKKLMNQSYKNDTMQNRLARIEEYMFGTVFDNEDEKTRINRISSAYNAQKSSGKYDSNKFAQNMTAGLQIGMLILMVLACIL